MHCCELLNKAAEDKKSFVVSDENYEYDLKREVREKKTDRRMPEKILSVKGMV